jgi:rubrerythrin
MAVTVQSIKSPSRRELRCGTCGYGVVVRIAPPFCPMCRSHAWVEVAQHAESRPHDRDSTR